MIVPERKLTKEGAEKAYLGKTIRVFGKVSKYTYEDSGKEIYEIKVNGTEDIMTVN